MARPPIPSTQSPEAIDATSLRRALLRLEQRILAPSPPDSRLQHSRYERARTGATLEYARTLLLRLEHSAAGGKAQARKHAQQAELGGQRALIRRMTDRLYELNQQDDDDDEGGGDEEDAEDLLARYYPTPAAQPLSAAGGHSRGSSAKGSLSSQAAISTSKPETTTTSTLRSRNTGGPSATGAGLSTSLFSPSQASTSKSKAHTDAQSPLDTTGLSPASTTLLQHNDTLQTDLTSSLLSLAAQLKQSSLAFADDLALDSSTLSATEAALGKNRDGMDSATGRMGVLRRMSEGRWWWQRYILYLVIFGLWVIAFGVVFVGPKLRF